MMFQHPQQWRSRSIDRAWLSMLVDAFVKTSQIDGHVVLCDEPVLLALKAQLARPAAPRRGYGPGRLLN
jgi:hypothetical protein